MLKATGIEPGKLNPLVVRVMLEKGIDISGNKTKIVHDLIEQGKFYHYIITIGHHEIAKKIPAFSEKVKKFH